MHFHALAIPAPPRNPQYGKRLSYVKAFSQRSGSLNLLHSLQDDLDLSEITGLLR